MRAPTPNWSLKRKSPKKRICTGGSTDEEDKEKTRSGPLGPSHHTETGGQTLSLLTRIPEAKEKTAAGGNVPSGAKEDLTWGADVRAQSKPPPPLTLILTSSGAPAVESSLVLRCSEEASLLQGGREFQGQKEGPGYRTLEEPSQEIMKQSQRMLLDL